MMIQRAHDDLSFAGDAESVPPSLSLLLAAGGDARIWPDPATGRNRYGTRTTPCADEISFASTTASNVSAKGFAAADLQLKKLFGADGWHSTGLDGWFADIRDRLADTLGCAEANVMLAASGTDVELFAAAIVAGVSDRPLTNILIAPEETGSGVPRAAAGRHFADVTALGRPVVSNALLAGIPADRVEVHTVAIRNALGQARAAGEIDADVVDLVEQALKRDRDVLLHVLDTSKTGLTGVTRQTARALSSLAPGRVRVLVDACQFRCGIATLRQDVADGFMVAVTGSKFLAGPPFCGALVIPPALSDELAARPNMAAGLSDYIALHDWPQSVRDKARLEFGSHFNLALGLRWTAALAHLDALAETADDVQRRIKAAFAGLVRERIADVAGASIHEDDEGAHIVERAIVPVTISSRAGGFASLAQAQGLHLAMREHAGGPVCHVGQAVNLGKRTILRIAASAVDITAVSAGLAKGKTLEQAMQPIASDLDVLFEKWAAVSKTIERV